MDEGYLIKDCVISADHGDGEKGQKITRKEIGGEAFERLRFNGALSKTPVKPAPKKKG